LRPEAQATEDRNVSPVGPCEAIPRCGLPDALIGKLLPCLVAFFEVRKVHGPEHFGSLGELNVAIFNYFNSVAPGIEEIKKITFEQSGAGGADEVTNTSAIIYN
jgi:hypothetical protein